ncbi:hypothetical protein N1851_022218 [Merluccius polli]|uniref:Uncharacterized protein n=1 Tax=Merluccius polli TaxID=89951 RepID=A0AA47NW18_MERPO|nr:hypothetical protein N1851_022218 [Merluccius polli]
MQTTLNYSSLSSDTLVATRISERLADIHKWTTAHHLKLNLHKTELLFMLGKDCPHMDLQVTVEGIAVSPSPTVRNFGVVLDNPVCGTANITTVATLYNIHRIQPFFTQEAAQLLVQALIIFRLNYCNSLLAGLPVAIIKPLQHIQNTAVRLVVNLPKSGSLYSLN